MSLEGAGTRELYAAYWEIADASRRTFFADLKVLREEREAARLRSGIGAPPPGPDDAVGGVGSVGDTVTTSPSTSPQSGAPGRPTLVSSWFWCATAVDLALDAVLPREMATSVPVWAHRLLPRLGPPRRVGGAGSHG